MGLEDRPEVRVTRRPNLGGERDPGGGLDPRRRVATSQTQHCQRGVEALLIDGDGLEDPVHDRRGVLTDPGRPLADPSGVPWLVARPLREVMVVGLPCQRLLTNPGFL